MKYFALFAALLLLVPGLALAQCSVQGDIMMRYGFGQLDGLPYNQPGPDYADIYAGQTLIYTLGPCNIGTYIPNPCNALDTICFSGWDTGGWTLAGNPPFGEAVEIDPGYLWYNEIHITAPCNVTIGQTNTIVAKTSYINLLGVCDPTCADCADPNVRPATGVPYYNADTLYLTVVEAPPALGVFQDTLTLVERGQTQAYVPFTICNQDECSPGILFNYSITTTGHVPTTIPGSSINVVGGDCADVYAVLNAGSSVACTYDTLTIIVWAGTAYDTCVQIIHVVEPEPVPLFTVPVVTILVLALILAAAVFMRRRAAARA